MQPSHIYLPALIIFGLNIFSCKKDESPSGCCGTPSIEASFGNATIFVPNIFTPNGDGINDLLQVYGDSIRIISNLEITTSNGIVVFSAMDVFQNDPVATWDGYVNGIKLEGLFDISVTSMAEDGTIKIFKGKVYNYPCGDATFPHPVNTNDCHFPSQVDNGVYNHNIPSGENSDCFE
ncbi:MAG: gliding motility-associated C-terminal domain-containing protein [Bacteroidota bacterium]|nr:gliding motility-associated C-terminal domain-containing protein [Bacteroidota bacterium]